MLAGHTVAEWSLAAARRVCDGTVLVVPAGHTGACAGWADRVVQGGASRSGSVRAALGAVPPGAGVVVVHDGARPLSQPATWQAVVQAVLEGAAGAVPCLPVTDTIKERDEQGRVRTLDRSRLLAAQTPQAFSTPVLREAYAQGGEATDDCALVEAMGAHVVCVPGDHLNFKVTSPSDLVVAEHLLAQGALGSVWAGAVGPPPAGPRPPVAV